MGFLGSLLSAQNNYQAKAPTSASGTPLAQTDYSQALQQAMGQGNQVFGEQQGLVNSLSTQANGGGPNLGAAELQQATDRVNAQASGLISSQKGINPALAARQILSQQASNNQNLAQQAGIERMQQQLGAQQQLGNTLGQMGALGNSNLNSLAGAQQAQNALNVQQSLGVQGINAGVSAGNQQAANSFFGGAGGAGAGTSTGGLGQGLTSAAALLAHGGKVPALVSPGEKIVPPGKKYDEGGMVPGQAQVPGDSEQNDTVPAMLTPGTVVVPRSVTQKLDPEAVKNFMDAVRGEKGYGKVVSAKKKWKGGKV